ncbi:MAG TPA: LysR family transcriptional regulator [Candidatus Cybelea sp.]|nr:LysR family transcriptional regulator [Candidatus Cybelea sp.]
METADLRTFVAVARRSSFAAVAREQNADPSSVSRAIAGIEAELGVRLFQRTTRRMVLTEAGALFLARVSPLIEELDRVQDEVVGARLEPSGPLRLTASVAFGAVRLTPLLPALRTAFPRLQFELLFTDDNLDLIAERVDLAIRLAPSYRADLIGVKLFPTRYHVVAGPRYLKREPAPRTPQELSRHACLLYALPEFRSRWLFKRSKVVTEVPVQGSFIFSSALVIRTAAVDGLGPALLADWQIADDLKAGRLVDLFPGYQATATTFDTAAWLLYPSRTYIPRKVRAVIDWLRRNMR